MPPPDEDALREVAAAWLANARGDLAAGTACATSATAVPGWIIGFHCQQAVEKAFKGLLVLRGIAPPRSHDLNAVAQMLESAGRAAPVDTLQRAAMMPFAVAERYPAFSAPDITLDDSLPLLAFARPAVDALAEELAADSHEPRP